jgi:hypothetical protein
MNWAGDRNRVSSHAVVLAAVPAVPLAADRGCTSSHGSRGGQAETAATTALAAAAAQPTTIPHMN